MTCQITVKKWSNYAHEVKYLADEKFTFPDFADIWKAQEGIWKWKTELSNEMAQLKMDSDELRQAEKKGHAIIRDREDDLERAIQDYVQIFNQERGGDTWEWCTMEITSWENKIEATLTPEAKRRFRDWDGYLKTLPGSKRW